MKRTLEAAALALVMTALIAGDALCWLIPTDGSIPPLAIKSQRVKVTVKDQVAKTVVTQVFLNSTDRQLEATYVFPLPEHAAVSDFSMWVGGKEVKGEILERDKARQVYEDIVRRIKDPALLEHMGGNVFKVRVFPIEPRSEQKIEITYSERVPYDSGLCRYVYPLNMGEKASQVLEDFTFTMDLASSVPIRTVYSPSHKVDVNRKGENSATVGFEENRSVLNRDFEVYYTLSKNDLGVNLITHKPEGSDGYFMLMITPKQDVKDDEVVPVDTTFVIDTSGSMRGEKMAQARNALKFCVQALRKHDRFNVVRFSTEVESFKPSPVEATEENRAEALRFIEKLEARGGTAIDDALKAALSQKREGDRPHMVMFLTDGLPTVGEQNVDSIIRNSTKAAGSARVFCFGVGYDVNTRLLGTLAEQSKASVEYVRPEEDIEVKVGILQEKIAAPVMTDVTLDLGKVATYDVYPKRMPDLFAGSQMFIVGRYRGAGQTAVTLEGKAAGKSRKVVEDLKFPDSEKSNDFLPRLWAERKVGYLIDEMRNHGENKELVDEVVRLAKEYGIVTPYTSFLVVPDEVARTLPQQQREQLRRMAEPQLGRGGGDRPDPTRAPGAAPAAPPAERPFTEEEKAKAVSDYAHVMSTKKEDRKDANSDEFRSRLQSERQAGESGARAVESARALDAMKEGRAEYYGGAAGGSGAAGPDSPSARTAAGLVRSIGERTFVNIAGVWVEKGYDGSVKPMKVKAYSEAYFELIKIVPEGRKVLALGDEVIFRLGAKYVHVGQEGIETLDELKEAMK